MDSKHPSFDGDIDGVKLNSFIFQFESYVTFKGYDLELDGTIVGLALGQCVRKSAATWYEPYMQRQEDVERHPQLTSKNQTPNRRCEQSCPTSS
ncbi:hypothetical protein DVH05_007513, partial [Phytophthora capsici]